MHELTSEQEDYLLEEARNHNLERDRGDEFSTVDEFSYPPINDKKEVKNGN